MRRQSVVPLILSVLVLIPMAFAIEATPIPAHEGFPPPGGDGAETLPAYLQSPPDTPIAAGGSGMPAGAAIPEQAARPPRAQDDSSSGRSRTQTDEPPVPADLALAREALQSAPLMFIENVGQFDESARFQVRGGGGALWLAENALWIPVVEPGSEGAEEGGPEEQPVHASAPEFRKGVNLRLSFVGANPSPRLEPFNRVQTSINYFMGDNPEEWRSDVPVWGGVRYVDLYPGIDLVVDAGLAPMRGEPQELLLPWRLEVGEAADVSDVRLRVEGVDALTLDGNALRLGTAVGDVLLPLLSVDGAAPADQSGASGANLTETLDVGRGAFEVCMPFRPPLLQFVEPQHSPSLQDTPSDLLYSTFMGGSVSEAGSDVTVDDTGIAYVTGHTTSSDFPTTPGAFDTSHNGGAWYAGDAYVVKLNTNDSELKYASFLGGSGADSGEAIAIDEMGNAYIVGDTESSDFPVTMGAFDTNYNNNADAFIAKLSADGADLVYATFLGGGFADYGDDVSVDGAGYAYVIGATMSPDLPVTPGAIDTTHNGGGYDAFVVKVTGDGTGLIFATFLGGSGYDGGSGIDVDSAGCAYVTGSTDSSDFPTTDGAYDTSHNGGPSDAYVAKLNSAGTALSYATFIGGTQGDSGHSIVVDGTGEANIAGLTRSPDLPTTAGASDTSHNGGLRDAFVTKVNKTGTGLVYSTFLGGSNDERNPAIAADGAGNVYVTGGTNSGNFPITEGAYDTSYNGGYYGDAFVVKMNADGTRLDYATFLGGNDSDGGNAIALDGAGSLYVAGYTRSSDFPTTPGAHDTTCGTDGDCNYDGNTEYPDTFVAKLAVSGEPSYSISGHVHDGSGDPVSGVTISADTGGSTATDSDGAYAIAGLSTGTYTLTPSKSGYTFSPYSRTVSVPPYATGQDFVGSSSGGETFTISGVVTDADGDALSGVTVSAGAGVDATTDANGDYATTDLVAGTYTLTPSKSGYIFSPATRTVSVPPDATGEDFVGSTGSPPCDPARQPVLLVHGWGGNDVMADDIMGFAQLYQWMQADGYVEDCNLFYAKRVRAENSREMNRTAIKDSLRNAYVSLANENSPGYNPDWRGHFDIIGHSYGGLNARFYLESSYYEDDQSYGQYGIHVDNLFTLGSPHGGARLWEEAYPGAIYIAKDHTLEPVNLYDFLSAAGLLSVTMDLYNLSNRQPDGVCYRLIGGDFLQQSDVPTVVRVAYAPFVASPGDIGVSLRSSLWLDDIDAFLRFLYPRVISVANSDMHGYFPKLPAPIVGELLDLSQLDSYVRPESTYTSLIAPFLGASIEQCQTTQAHASSPIAAAGTEAEDLAPAPILIATDVITGGQSAAGSVLVDWQGPTAFHVSWMGGDVDLSLRDPSGTSITPTSVLNDPNAGYGKALFGASGLAAYVLTDTLTGTWNYTVTAAGGPYPIALQLYLNPDSHLTVHASAPEWQPWGVPAVITASLFYSTTPVSGADVRARVSRPDGNEGDIPLHDDGLSPDNAAGDGIYSGVYTDTSEGGFYHVLVEADGTYASESYHRNAQAVLTVAYENAGLTGAYADGPSDDDGDGLYEYLEVAVGVDATQLGHFTLAARLEDGEGRLIDLANTTVYSATGAVTLTLRFDGRAIRASELDGPYTVTGVLLVDDTSLIKLDEADDAWVTPAYEHHQFGVWASRLYLPVIVRNR